MGNTSCNLYTISQQQSIKFMRMQDKFTHIHTLQLTNTHCDVL